MKMRRLRNMVTSTKAWNDTPAKGIIGNFPHKLKPNMCCIGEYPNTDPTEVVTKEACVYEGSPAWVCYEVYNHRNKVYTEDELTPNALFHAKNTYRPGRGIEEVINKPRLQMKWEVDTGPSKGTFEIVEDEKTGGKKGTKLARFDCIPQDVLWELAEHYGRGQEKYPDVEPGQANWQRGYNWNLSYAALMRHLSSWLQGEDVDEETGSNHLIAVIWHAMALRWFQIHGKGTDTR